MPFDPTFSSLTFDPESVRKTARRHKTSPLPQCPGKPYRPVKRKAAENGGQETGKWSAARNMTGKQRPYPVSASMRFRFFADSSGSGGKPRRERRSCARPEYFQQPVAGEKKR